jgi:hypothetical protein
MFNPSSGAIGSPADQYFQRYMQPSIFQPFGGGTTAKSPDQGSWVPNPNYRNQLAQIMAPQQQPGSGGSHGYDFNPMTGGNPSMPGMGGYSLPGGWSPAGTTQGQLPGWLSSIMPSWMNSQGSMGQNPGWGYNAAGNRSSATGLYGSHGGSSGGYTTSGRGW